MIINDEEVQIGVSGFVETTGCSFDFNQINPHEGFVRERLSIKHCIDFKQGHIATPVKYDF